jgi:hypothetical protein
MDTCGANSRPSKLGRGTRFCAWGNTVQPPHTSSEVVHPTSQKRDVGHPASPYPETWDPVLVDVG